ncbi:ABC transporter ATP-binding protein [Clostridium sp.]|uniref:ABC transporter ATP-binding protein n=1 Tax=Clostridium sp. TaxID=1506 RepID=UPI001A60F99E|nr:ABC transporter ATP-binding protein [Clostridium sp.]MBK5240131.1 ABC transporter ATP-binding protein [Clostridium sp.]
MTNKALEINNLNGRIGDFSLNNINFSIESGTIMGFIGKNGSGKTTLIKTILNMLDKKSGEVLFDGLPMYGNEEIVKAKIGVVFDSLIYPLNLKPRKIKKMISPFYKTFDDEKFDELMKRFELDPRKKLSTYSKGMQMKFGVVMALCHNPELIILDEPTAGLDPIARAEVMDLLLELMQNEKRSILFSTHITSDLEKIADYITMIDDGKIVFTKGKDEMLDTYLLVQIEKEAMTDAIKSGIIGLKETTFGYQGLSENIKLKNLAGVKTARPTIEDIMIYMGSK